MIKSKTTRRDVLSLGVSAALFPIVAISQENTSWPSQPVHIIVPFAPGGAIDAISRIMSEGLRTEFDKPFVIENKTGAAGNIGAEFVAKSRPDGYTLLVGTSATHGANPELFKNLKYDAVKDFQPIALWGSVPNVLVVSSSSGPKNIKELINAARRDPGSATYGSAGSGTSLHLAAVMFEQAANINLRHIPYRGAGPAMLDLLAGNISMMFNTLTAALPHIKSGKLRAFAVTSAERDSSIPDIPTFAELGYPKIISGTWAGLFVPKDTPKPVIDGLIKANKKLLEEKSIQESIKQQGARIMPLTGSDFGNFVNGEIKLWGDIIRSANITAQ